jgi:hypothetical protein
MNNSEILTKSWKIVWKHKVLWIFGVLAGCLQGGGSGSGGGNGGYRPGVANGDNPFAQYLPQAEEFFNRFTNNVEPYLGIIAAILFGLCVLWLLAIGLGTMGRIGLIQGSLQADGGAESLSFGEIWGTSQLYFGRVLGLWLTISLLGFVLGLSFAVLAIVAVVASFGIGLVCLLPFLLVLIPVSWVVNLLVEQATLAIVIEDRSLSEAFRRAWQLLRANLGAYVLMALMLFLIQLVIGVMIALPVFLVIVPALIGVFMGAGNGINMALLISGLCFVVYLPVLIVLNGILQAYVQTAWTLTFARLTALIQTELLDAS